MICRDRTGYTADFVLEKIDTVKLATALKPLIAEDAILCLDGEKALAAAAQKKCHTSDSQFKRRN